MHPRIARFPGQAGALFVSAHALLGLTVANSPARSGICSLAIVALTAEFGQQEAPANDEHPVSEEGHEEEGGDKIPVE